MSYDQALDNLSEKKLSSRLLVQEEHGFQKGHNVPPGRRSSKKPGLDRVKPISWRGRIIHEWSEGQRRRGQESRWGV